MKPKAIIIDIDNTLLTQNKRKQVILEKLFGVAIPISQIENDYDMSGVFEQIATQLSCDLNEIKSMFLKEYSGLGFTENENFDCIEYSVNYLNLLAKELKIIYLSARHESMETLTKQQLKYFGFPEVNDNDVNLILTSQNQYSDGEDNDNFEKFNYSVLNFKTEIVYKLLKEYDIVAGVGANVIDLLCYNNCDILAVILKSHSYNIEEMLEKFNLENNHKIDKYSYITLDTWSEVYRCIISVVSDKDELKEICIQHSNDYSKWMFDLDNKAYLILVAATFCVTSFISLLGKNIFESVILKILIFLGIITSVLSMYFAVQAFASRNTHGKVDLKGEYRGENKANRLLRWVRYFIPVLYGKFPECTKAYEDVFFANVNKECVNNSKFAEIAYLKYFKERYNVLNPNVIISKTLFALRDSNYKKILSERYARVFLNVTLCIVAIVSCCCIFGGNGTSDNNTKQINNEVYVMTETGVYKTVLELDDTCFDNEQISLSENGKRKIKNVCENSDEKYLICEISSKKNYENNKVSGYINSIKFELVKEYIDNTFGAEVILIVR